MINRLEQASRIPPYERGTSAGSLRAELGVGQPPGPAKAALPQVYGIPLLELLIVDTEYVFVSWEITPQQLELARDELGAQGFERRQLVLRLQADNARGEVLVEQELYGESGRWFIHHHLAGRLVTALLAFKHAQACMPLHAAGPVELPRDFVIEPTQYDELSVQYSVGATGELVLEGIHRLEQETWPAISLVLPSIEELAIPRNPVDHDGSRGIPSSPRPGLPGSPWSGGIFQEENPPPDLAEEDTR